MTDTLGARLVQAATVEERRDALVERLFGSVLGMLDLYALYMGDRLGLYRALAEGASTPTEVAAAAGVNERYAREWLEHQAVAGILEVEEGGSGRRFRLPAGHDEVVLDQASMNCIAPVARCVIGMVRQAPAVMAAFRTGGGVPYEAFDADFCDGQGDMNGAMFDSVLGTEWLPAVGDVHERLMATPPARVADVACGTGRSTIAIARAYPQVRVDGIDVDAHSLEVARANLAAAPDVADRVAFRLADAGQPGAAEPYDLVTIFEAVHDLPRPVEVLSSVRALLAPGGSAIVADERVAEQFQAPGDEVERLMYGYSILHCLPVGMDEQPSAATGTVMRPDQLRAYALAAGFSGFEILPIDNVFWRFYRLTP